jgi:hypothetical protein
MSKEEKDKYDKSRRSGEGNHKKKTSRIKYLRVLKKFQGGKNLKLSMINSVYLNENSRFQVNCNYNSI